MYIYLKYSRLLLLCLTLCGWIVTHAQDKQPGIPVLIYHEITTDEARQAGDTVISLRRFQAEMEYLAQRGYYPIGRRELVAYMRSGAPVPSRARRADL